MKFEIVTHNHNYPRLLAWQLSSLVLHPPVGHQIKYSLWCEPEDAPLRGVINYFQTKLPSNVLLETNTVEAGLLRNRAHGRNLSALKTDADWVWFTDTDYMFLRNCWSDLYQQLLGKSDIRFAAPLEIYETDWPTGDQMIAEMVEPAVRDVDLFNIPKVNKHIAIGGLQIAHGPTVREIGYCGWLSGPREQWDFRSDIRFRRQEEMNPKLEVKLDAVLRIRHSQRGYGQTDWKEVRN